MGKIVDWLDGKKIVREMTEADLPQEGLDDRKARAMAKVLWKCDQIAAGAVVGYVRMEVAAWPAKAFHARAMITGGASSVLLSTEAAELGVTELALAERIVAKAEVYETLIAKLAAIRQKAEALIERAPSAEVLQATMETIYEELGAL